MPLGFNKVLAQMVVETGEDAVKSILLTVCSSSKKAKMGTSNSCDISQPLVLH
jgi:hypothetical protein